MTTKPHPRVFFFDVFGTVVEWRNCISRALNEAAQRALQDSNKELSADVRAKVTSFTIQDWLDVAEEWRDSYKSFTRCFDPSQQDFISVDQHHYTSLLKLLQDRNIETLFTDSERWDLALSWHRLTPWSDSVRGLELLNRKFRTSTLSNGNISLLEDLRRYGSLPFTDITSAEQFGAYKPSPKVYGGAAEKFGIDPGECVLVAAHLADLMGAKASGFQTVYVERFKEEDIDPEQAKQEGYVDVWVDSDSEGFIEVARRFEIKSTQERL